MDAVGHFRTFFFGKDVGEHVLNLLFDELDVEIFFQLHQGSLAKQFGRGA
jgi:hypothetical protein